MPSPEVNKPPCVDCLARIVGHCPVDSDGPDEPTSEKIWERLEQLIANPLNVAITGVGLALNYCDHLHRWGEVVGMSEEDVHILKGMKAKRKNFPRA